MLAYGYDWEGKTLHSLRENSLVCSRTELDTLIAFLQDVRTAAEEDAQDSEHWHLRVGWRTGRRNSRISFCF